MKEYLRKGLRRLTEDAKFVRKLNGWLAIIWFFLAFPICVFLNSSIPVLVFISVYAIFVSHWAGYIAGNTEVKQDESEDGLVEENRHWITNEVTRIVEKERSNAGNR